MTKRIVSKMSICSSNGNGKSESPVAILSELQNVDREIEKLETRHNLLLRDLRQKVGKSFRHEGRTYQIRRRGNKYYIAKMDSGLSEIAELPEELEHAQKKSG